MSNPSPKLGSTPSGCLHGWSGSETSNQKGSKGHGEGVNVAKINRQESDNTFMQAGRGNGTRGMSRFRPSGRLSR